MSQSYTVVFSKLDRTSIVRVHGAPGTLEAFKTAEDFLGDPKYHHVTTITGIPETQSLKLDRFEEVDWKPSQKTPTGVIPRLMKGKFPFDGELITNGFTIDCFYKIRGWEGSSAIVLNDNGDERVIAMYQQPSAHIKIRSTVEGEGGTHTREKCAGYFEVVR